MQTSDNEMQTYIDERLHSEKGQIGLLIGVVNEVEIDELLHLNISLLHAVDDIDEQLGHILTDSHKGNDLLQGVLLGIHAGGSELLLDLVGLSYPSAHSTQKIPLLPPPKNFLSLLTTFLIISMI